MNRHVEEKKIAGSVVLVARRGKIAYFKAFGKADTHKPMQKGTIFRMASMSKPLTSTAVMLLYEEGRILLSDPISKYIPEFKKPKVLTLLPEGSDPEYKLIPAKREITIRDLLSHTAGITYFFSSQRKDAAFISDLGDGLDGQSQEDGLAYLQRIINTTSCWL